MSFKETEEEIIFEQKTMFAEGIQDYETGLVIDDEEIIIKMAKLPKHVRDAKFVDSVIPLNDEHNKSRVIGFVDNFVLVEDQNKGVHWNGDFHFQKKMLSPNDLEQLQSLEKRDVSIGFFFTPIEADENDPFDIIQTEILIDHVAWTIEGRCSYPTCGLDNKPQESNIVNLLNIVKEKYNNDSKKSLNFDSKIRYFDHMDFEVLNIMPNDCKDKDAKIKSLETENDSLKAENLILKTTNDSTESKIKTLNVEHSNLIKEQDSKLKAVTKELEDLKIAITAERKTFDSNKKILEAYQVKEMDSLKKFIIESGGYTTEELKDYTLDNLKNVVEIISKIKPGFPVGSSPGSDSNPTTFNYDPMGENNLSELSKAYPKDGGK
jgi:hypothetical protein